MELPHRGTYAPETSYTNHFPRLVPWAPQRYHFPLLSLTRRGTTLSADVAPRDEKTEYTCNSGFPIRFIGRIPILFERALNLTGTNME